MAFWALAALLTFSSLALVLRPLLRGTEAAARRASYDVQVFRDQLREIDEDQRRGILTPDEAKDTRLEISRRLLAAADAEAAEGDAPAAPRRTARIAAACTGLVALALTGWLYVSIGAPGYPDQPLAERLARLAAERAERPSQDEVEEIVAGEELARPPGASSPEDVALVERLEALLRDRPDELEGHRLLARSLGAIGRFADARRAQERVIAILGDAAAAEDHVDHAELMIFAANGYVSPQAEAALGRALSLDPLHPAGRYFSGLTLLQGGRPDLAHRLWSGLLEEGPPDAPWIAAIEAEIDEVARLAGLPPRGGAAGPEAAPSPATAPEMTPQEERTMIEGMVAGLGERLAAEGGPPQDWAQLIRSLGVLGRGGEAAAIWSEAREVFAGDAAGLAVVAEAARAAGVAEADAP